jgi:hypothetical protein
LLNGGFEFGGPPTYDAIYWFGSDRTTQYAFDTPNEIGRVCELSAEGDCMLRINATTVVPTPRILSQEGSYPLLAGDRLVLSAQFAGESLVVGGGAYLRVFYTDGSSNFTFLPAPSGTFGYTTLTGELIVENKPLDFISVSIELPGESTGVLRVDDMRLSVTDYRLVTPQAPLPTATPTPTATP